MKYLICLIALFLAGCGADPVAGPMGPSGSQGERGLQGEAGETGADAEIVVMTPCPEIPDPHPEAVWKVGTTAYAVYVNGFRIHLTALIPGQDYQTTDNRNCTFQVDENGDLVL